MRDDALRLAMALCVRFEGVYLRPYLCPAGVPTIGVGATRYLGGMPVTLADPAITREHAMVLLRERILREFMPAVLRNVPNTDTSGRLAALVDFAYNVGVGAFRASTMARRARAGRWDLVAVELRKWTRGGGRVLPGLVKRRAAEISLL